MVNNQTIGQNLSTEGKDFWFGFMNNWDRDPADVPISLEVYVSAVDTTQGVLSIPNLSGFQPVNFEVVPGLATRISLNTQEAMAGDESGIGNKGIHLTAEKEISVFAINKREFSADETGILPTYSLSNEYIVMSHWETGNKQDDNFSDSELLIVATEDQTIVDIIPSVLTENDHQPGETLSVTLNQGETYQLMARGDLTGTKVTARISGNNSCTSIAVFGGNQCTMVGLCEVQSGMDHLFAQMYPIKTWGKEYITVSYEPREGGDEVKVLAAEDNTAVNLAGETVNLDANEWIQRRLDNENIITSDKPITVGQFSRTQGCDGTTADPFFVVLSPNEQLLTEITFNAPDIVSTTIFSLNVIAPTVGLEDLLLDDQVIQNYFEVVPGNSVYSFARISIDGGNHTLKSPHGFIAYVYGYGDNESFGYSAGANLSNLSLGVEIRNSDGIQIPFNKLCKNDLISFKPVTDEPYNQYDWDFGDGTKTTSFTQDPVFHQYKEEGKYTLKLTGFSEETSCEGGGEQTEVQNLTVINPILPVFGPRSVCPDTEDVLYYTENPEDFSTDWLVEGGTIIESHRDSIRVNWGSANSDAAIHLLATNTAAFGCTGDSVRFPVKVNVRLEPEAPLGADSICLASPDDHQYSAYYFQGSVYDWQVEGGEIIEGQGEQSVMVNWLDRNEGKIWFHQSVPGDEICDGTSDTLIVIMEGTPDSIISLFPEKRQFQVGEPFTLKIEADTLFEFVSWVMDGENMVDSARLDEEFHFQYACPGTHELQITAYHEYGSCTNRAFLSSEFTIIPPKPEIIQVTSDTSEALKMDISWVMSDDDYGDFERLIYRKSDEGIKTHDVEETQEEFNEYGTNTSFNYEYYFSISDVGCDQETISVSHYNMVLDASAEENSNLIKLEWSPYLGWENGVLTYEIYQSIDGYSLAYVGNTDMTNFTVLQEPIGIDYCFRVMAIEKMGNEAYSWSNESCVSFVPELYAYNVFTPNGDEQNQTFVIDNVEAYRKSKLLIIDRNGQTVYEQLNYQNDWDGDELPSGIYYFVLELNEPRADRQTINGYVQIIR